MQGLPFTRNQILTDDASQRACLGALYDPAHKWPVTARSGEPRVDMRLMSRHDMFDEGAPDELRPAAQALYSRLCGTGQGEFVLVSSSGTGKSAAMIDAGHRHFNVFMQASLWTSAGVAGDANRSARLSREFDQDFAKMVEDIRNKMSTTKEDLNVLRANYVMAKTRSKQELVARLLQLVRMHVEAVEAKEELEPWDFMVQQLTGPQKFISSALEEVKLWDDRQLNKVAELIQQELAPLLGPERRLMLCFDEIEFGLSIDAGSFLRDEHKGQSKGVLSPLSAAAGELQSFVGWQIVFAGTGTTAGSAKTLETDVGKSRELNIINAPELFPTCTAREVELLLRRLALPAQARVELANLGQRLLDETVPANASLRESVEFYVVGGRFRLLCGIVERVGEVMARFPDVREPSGLLSNAVGRCVERHKEGLFDMFKQRLGEYPEARLHAADALLEYLHQIYVATTLMGNGATFLQSRARAPEVRDLVALGVAVGCKGRPVREGVGVKVEFDYLVCERFVLDVIVGFFASDTVRSSAQAAAFRQSVDMLRTLLGTYGPTAQFKGNVVERVVLQQLVALGQSGRYAHVADLPFFPADQPADSPWRSQPFAATALQTSAEYPDVPAFLASERARGVVFSPDSMCRPDGVLMLPEAADGQRRALVVGVAVYSASVTSAKVTNQFSSTDLSRAYLSAAGQSYPAAQRARHAWFDAALHTTVALRVHVSLPVASSEPPADQQFFRETTRDGSGQPVRLPAEHGAQRRSQVKALASGVVGELDVVVNLDKRNVPLLLGAPSSSAAVRALYELLKVATRDAEGWPA